MKLNEFIELLAETKDRYKWHVDQYGNLRGKNRKGECHCPLSAVAAYKTHKRMEPCAVSIPTKKLGLSIDLADTIIDAADTDGSFGEYRIKRIRNAMLRAVGLPVKRR